MSYESDKAFLAEIFLDLKRGDPEAFERLDEKFRSRFVRFARTFANCDLNAAEDIVQDAMMKLFSRISTLEFLERSYLYQRVVFSCLEYVDEKKRRKKEISLESAGGKSDAGDPQPLDPVDQSTLEPRSLFDSEDVRLAVSQMDAKYREVLLSSEIDERNQNEIAETVGYSDRHVRNVLPKAIKQLRRLLADLNHPSP